MDELEQDYRLQIQFRRKGQGAFDSQEVKTENFDNIDQLLLEVSSIIQCTLEEDREYLTEQLENGNE